MSLPIANHKDFVSYRGNSIPFKGLGKVIINFERRIITYEVYVDTVLQGIFVEDEFRKGSIIFDKVFLGRQCTIYANGANYPARFLHFVYNSTKNKYQCSFEQDFQDPKEKETILSDSQDFELPPIEPNRFNMLDLS